jgi:hypothetical protein
MKISVSPSTNYCIGIPISILDRVSNLVFADVLLGWRLLLEDRLTLDESSTGGGDEPGQRKLQMMGMVLSLMMTKI